MPCRAADPLAPGGGGPGGPRPPGGRRLLPALSLALLLALGTACGSRLPESAFGRRTEPPAGTATRTTDPIRIGIIASITSPVGGDAFAGPGEGARAWFAALNARGGIGGRPVEVHTCDDGGSGVGNNACVHELLDEKKVFALVATTALDYAGAPLVSRAAVPDIGGQPLGTAYDTHPHLYGIYGSNAPRDGRSPGWDGTLYAGTEVYRFFHRTQGARTAAVVSYNQAASAGYARQLVRGLEAEGYRVTAEQVDFALPNFRAVAADLKARGTDLVFDALDTHGNARLCEALDEAGVRLTAKVTNVQNWNDAVRTEYAKAPGCRNTLWVTGSSRNHADAADPAVAAFRAAMVPRLKGRPLSQWQLEGWAAAMWFTDAARSCGADLTRPCVERFLNRAEPYTAGGLLLPVSFRPAAEPPRTHRACLSAARWQDGRGWVTQGGEMTANCADVPLLPHRP
ncbi:ABC transporter substrate-binding protein [Streptomyces bambusae]|uniref:ABC transporter substrate-binding protein n=1 Tax=Streptomyces bambusae TaxID=1550616 RepID=UPI001CFD40A7|nr:ABC transporter substrate-binding protein [Streptomyces bambusae]MCB5167091.1 ABC transporter substrate-binding protein [Streptomyces bambusae]